MSLQLKSRLAGHGCRLREGGNVASLQPGSEAGGAAMMRNIDARPVPRFILVLMLHLASLVTLHAAEQGPYLYVLGVAQDAGYPQAGCYEPHCMPGWQEPKLRRGATSVALVMPESGKKYLFEATPHLPSQLYFLEQEAPSADNALAGQGCIPMNQQGQHGSAVSGLITALERPAVALHDWIDRFQVARIRR